MSTRLQSGVLGCALLLIVILGFLLNETSQRIDNLENNVRYIASTTDSAVDRLESILLALREENENLDSLQEKYEKELAGISFNVSQQEQKLASSNIALAVNRWAPFVHLLECELIDTSTGRRFTSRGSIVFQKQASGILFSTSRHTLEEDGATLERCEITHPDSTEEYTLRYSDIIFDEKRDLASGTISAGADGFEVEKICPRAPGIGDRVLVLGYPRIGSEDSVTATEGIISGYEDDFYLSSAKIDRGNSGGAAIDLARDCLLGIPTLTIAGSAESLARILPLP